MDGQAKLFSFGFSRGRSGNQPEPNPSSSGSSEHIRKPSSSKESTSSQLEEEQRSRSQSVTAPSSIPGFDNGCLLARRGAGEGVSDSGKLAYLKNRNGTIDRSFAFPKRFLNGCQRQFKANGWTSTNGLRTPHRRTEVSTVRSVSQTSRSRCCAVDHEAHDQLDKSFTNPEGAHCQQNAQREC